MEEIVIIGAGASGLLAGILAAQNGSKVLILEHRGKAGKELLMTGNGKCNLTNMNDFHGKYYSNHLDKAYEYLGKFSPEKTRELFCKLGLYTKEKKDGTVYPVTEQAVSVLDILLAECRQYHVRLLLNADAKKIFPCEHRLEYIEEGTRKQLTYQKLILATGGKSISKSGSDGSGYYLSGQLGHTFIEPLPALVSLVSSQQDLSMISGVRTQAKLSLYIDRKWIQEEEGELQLTDTGISGIPVFQFSRNAAVALQERKRVEVLIDFLPYLSAKDKEQLFLQAKQKPQMRLEEYLEGFLHKKLCVWIAKQLQIDLNQKIGSLSEKVIVKLFESLGAYPFEITATNSFEQAQVTRGGIPLDEVDEHLQSRLAKDVFFTGEVLDCDGICGGYNLQWAWTTAWIVAHAVTA